MAALAALLQAGFLVVDTFWLGRVGAVAIAAASGGAAARGDLRPSRLAGSAGLARLP